MKLGLAPLLIAAASQLLGCAGQKNLALDRASRELGCPRAQLHAEFVSGSQIGDVYKVSGCGAVATYVCLDTREECLRENDNPRQGR
ncbi:MAG TPA: hypothetical protein VNW92_19695 [Polyangiaceae bacterium]|nr:hypothetical protein [Polyangiaceae bacterium]